MKKTTWLSRLRCAMGCHKLEEVFITSELITPEVVMCERCPAKFKVVHTEEKFLTIRLEKLLNSNQNTKNRWQTP